MSSPDKPLRFEYRVEVPGTPEQVWDALATANGITAWFLPTDLEEREGGAVRFHMGETSSPGKVTRFEPPQHFAYEEPEWASLAGQDVESVTPLVTEFLVEATSGGTCVVHVVSSAFGSGADWEQEFFDDMARHFVPFFDNLRLYLAHFPGQRVTQVEAGAQLAGGPEQVWAAMRQAFGELEVGKPFELRGHAGHVERLGDEEILVRLDQPADGFLSLYTFGLDGETAMAGMRAYLFSDDAGAVAEREQPGWQAWLEALPLPAPS